MDCEKCMKHHATYHLTSIENSKKTEIHLCDVCAKMAGVSFEFNHSLADILGNISGKSSKSQHAQCPMCKMTRSQFQRIGRLGCANDYSVFADIEDILRMIHGANIHVGKSPSSSERGSKEDSRSDR